MTAPAPKNVRTLQKFYNFNNILSNEYFGQISQWVNSWMDLVGDKYQVVHPDTNQLIELEFVGCFICANDEIEIQMDWARFSSFCPPTTIRDICGFTDDNFERWQKYFPLKMNMPLAIYVFKNLNYKSCH